MGLGDIFRIKEFKNEIARLQQENQALQSDKSNLESATAEMRNQLHKLGAFDYYKVKQMTEELQRDYDQKQTKLQEEYSEKQRAAEIDLINHISDLEHTISELDAESLKKRYSLNDLRIQESKLNKSLKTQTNKLNRSKELVKAINYALDNYLNYEPSQDSIKLPENNLSDLEEITPSIILKLHCMDTDFYQVHNYWPECKIFFITLPLVVPGAAGSIPDFQGQLEFWDKIKTVCRKYAVTVIDLTQHANFVYFVPNQASKYLYDSLHFNEEGYRFVAPYVESVIMSQL